MIELNDVVGSIIDIVDENIVWTSDDPNVTAEIDNLKLVRKQITDAIIDYVDEVKMVISRKISDLLGDIC